MNEFRSRIRPDWVQSLTAILDRARAMEGGGVVAFDLDSTLFDNRARQALIVREFGQANQVPELCGCQDRHWDSGWDMRAAMRNCGLSPARVEQLYASAKAFWQERFFTSRYCVEDTEIPGAGRFIDACLKATANVVYVTGRHEGMRDGTVSCLRRWGIAVPNGRTVHLLMKPTLQEDDDAFKRVAHEQLRAFGTVLAAFDNEPTHANDYRTKFPDAQVIHLATDHSGRKVELLDGIVSVPHFDLGAEAGA